MTSEDKYQQPSTNDSTAPQAAILNPSSKSGSNGKSAAPKAMAVVETPELDDFGLPIKKYGSSDAVPHVEESSSSSAAAAVKPTPSTEAPPPNEEAEPVGPRAKKEAGETPSAKIECRQDKQSKIEKSADPPSDNPPTEPKTEKRPLKEPSTNISGEKKTETSTTPDVETGGEKKPLKDTTKEAAKEEVNENDKSHEHNGSHPLPTTDKFVGTMGEGDMAKDVSKRDSAVPDPSHGHGHRHSHSHSHSQSQGVHTRDESLTSAPEISEFSHQQITRPKDQEDEDEDQWQTMPAYAPYDIYDDDNKLIAKEHHEEEDESYGYAGLGGAGKGYTRVLLDDDAESATSMDENTQYLFKNASGTSMMDDDDNQRDAVSQLQATKDLLTEGQRIAYVGLTRLELSAMVKEAESIDLNNTKKKPKKEVQEAAEAMKMWSQKMMIRLYSHMDISPAEQVMIEQLSDHGVVPADLTGALMANSRVQNPMRESESTAEKTPKEEANEGESGSGILTPSVTANSKDVSEGRGGEESPVGPPPAYEAHAHDGEDMPGVRTPSQLPTSQKLDIDLRWTVLCDLFLVLIADSIYDSRSRTLLERLGKGLEIPWLDICRFEKRVTDALEMQQQAEKENWNEEEHMEYRRKMALKRRYVMMGLATVGGGLVIGLSAGLLAPVIGAGLAAGFTTIGVTGTSSFLAGTASAAIITSGAAASGSYIGGKAANRRTGAVKTFEYRPLHNNKRVNLIVSVSGWMTGKVDDVRLPFSTVDPIMGDIYSVLWEPEMLTSMGDTINILATEALTQGLQQILGSTILISLMAALQLPIVLTKLSYLIDNPWAVSLDRATSAGLILADSLIERNLGTRPVTLVGYSLGSRVIFSCLQELAKKGAYGLVQNVYIFGSPVVVKTDEFLRARTVVAGRFVNGHNRNDWILGYLFRLTNGGVRRVAGLGPITEVAGIENKDVTEYVVGHMDYRQAMPRLLREVCGWLVESDEFTEIEDPDPENHQERQRELITEIEEARKELEKQGEKEKYEGKKKSRFSLFGRKKKLEKAGWEVYDDAQKKARDAAGGVKDPASGFEGVRSSGKTEDAEGNNHGVLFDVEAIRAELAREAIRGRLEENSGGGSGASTTIKEEELDVLQVKEIKSTLPPMKLDISTPNPSGGAFTPSPSSLHRPSLSNSMGYRETKSTSNLPYRGGTGGSSFDSRSSASPLPPGKSPAHQYGGDPMYDGGGWGGDGDEGEISMAFDTSFREPSPPPPPPPKDTPERDRAPSVTVTAAGGGSGSGLGIVGGDNGWRGAGNGTMMSGPPPAYGGSGWGHRPEAKTSKTAPVVPAANPWAGDEDFDDPDFGKEKDIEMTFA
ncbi:uncharacterized protein MKZ38_000386 [Zalerion maritima]|uniref:Uncharacterized protein n=1 Tax=Zalerion maritima TaxID=339359 RepID=A0AAD5RZG4_9PEZI|nr:uncharacterized protein MKZ38_000386 [Zalerion maritima]